MGAYANHRVSSSHENAGGAHADQPSDRPSGAPVATGPDHSDAYADYARSRLQAGLPVNGRQPTSFTPSRRQAETQSPTALDTRQRDERARATRDQEIATQRQAETESMQALAEPEGFEEQADETFGDLTSLTGFAVGVGNAVDHVAAWQIRSSAASILTLGNAGNLPANAAKAAALVGKMPASNPANWATHWQAYQKYSTVPALDDDYRPCPCKRMVVMNMDLGDK